MESTETEKQTGPRTRAGKARAKLNALKRSFAAPSFRESMIDLREDPAEYDRLYRDLLASCLSQAGKEPTDALWAKQVEDLARISQEKIEKGCLFLA